MESAAEAAIALAAITASRRVKKVLSAVVSWAFNGSLNTAASDNSATTRISRKPLIVRSPWWTAPLHRPAGLSSVPAPACCILLARERGPGPIAAQYVSLHRASSKDARPFRNPGYNVHAETNVPGICFPARKLLLRRHPGTIRFRYET